jgi:hypothetical protein
MTFATLSSTFGVSLILGAYSFRRRRWMTDQTYRIPAGDQHLNCVGQFQSTRVGIGLAHGEEFGSLTREVIETHRPSSANPTTPA